MARSLRRSVAAATTGLLATAALSGCQLLTAQAPVHTPTALETCATGRTWVLDTAALSASARTSMVERGLAVSVGVTGMQTLTWGSDFAMAFDTDLTFTGTVDGAAGFAQTQAVHGTSKGLAYFSGEIAVPRDWVEDLTVTETATQDGAPADPRFAWLPLWVNDTVGLKTTCAPDQLVLEPRQGHLVWTFHPEGWTPPAPSDPAEPAPAA